MGDDAKSKLTVWIPILISILTLLAGSGWGKYYLEMRQKQKEQDQKMVSEYLAPIQTLLQTNEAIKKRIYQDYREKEWGILESYVIKVRRDARAAEIPLMKQDIVTIAFNNKEMLDLLKKYSGYVKHKEFENESNNFIRHAQNWINRWAAIPELIKNTKDQLPYAEPFPEKFPEALKKEMAMYKSDT